VPSTVEDSERRSSVTLSSERRSSVAISSEHRSLMPVIPKPPSQEVGAGVFSPLMDIFEPSALELCEGFRRIVQNLMGNATDKHIHIQLNDAQSCGVWLEGTRGSCKTKVYVRQESYLIPLMLQQSLSIFWPFVNECLDIVIAWTEYKEVHRVSFSTSEYAYRYFSFQHAKRIELKHKKNDVGFLVCTMVPFDLKFVPITGKNVFYGLVQGNSIASDMKWDAYQYTIYSYDLIHTLETPNKQLEEKPLENDLSLLGDSLDLSDIELDHEPFSERDIDDVFGGTPSVQATHVYTLPKIDSEFRNQLKTIETSISSFGLDVAKDSDALSLRLLDAHYFAYKTPGRHIRFESKLKNVLTLWSRICVQIVTYIEASLTVHKMVPNWIPGVFQYDSGDLHKIPMAPAVSCQEKQLLSLGFETLQKGDCPQFPLTQNSSVAMKIPLSELGLVEGTQTAVFALNLKHPMLDKGLTKQNIYKIVTSFVQNATVLIAKAIQQDVSQILYIVNVAHFTDILWDGLLDDDDEENASDATDRICMRKSPLLRASPSAFVPISTSATGGPKRGPSTAKPVKKPRIAREKSVEKHVEVPRHKRVRLAEPEDAPYDPSMDIPDELRDISHHMLYGEPVRVPDVEQRPEKRQSASQNKSPKVAEKKASDFLTGHTPGVLHEGESLNLRDLLFDTNDEFEVLCQHREMTVYSIDDIDAKNYWALLEKSNEFQAWHILRRDIPAFDPANVKEDTYAPASRMHSMLGKFLSNALGGRTFRPNGELKLQEKLPMEQKKALCILRDFVNAGFVNEACTECYVPVNALTSILKNSVLKFHEREEARKAKK
jgi:hypothetical protein